MYKLIIIDDEYRSAKTMANFIDYTEFNFEVAGVFKSAESALDFMQETTVDLVVSDIKMKRVSGLELLKTINQKYPKTKVVLVSAYRDFSYAKDAISNNAFEYITKPISLVEYTCVLKRVAESLEDNSLNTSDFDKATELNCVISDYFNEIRDFDALQSHFKKYNSGINLLKCNCSVFSVNIPDIANFIADKWKYGSEKFFNAISQIIPMNMNNIFFSFLSDSYSNMRIIAIDLSDGDEYDNHIDDFISYVTYEIFSILGLNVDIVRINTANSIEELKELELISIKNTIKLLTHSINKNEAEKIENILDGFFSKAQINLQWELCITLTETLKENCGTGEINFFDDVCIKCIKNSQILKEYCLMIIKKAYNALKIAEQKNATLLDAIYYISTNFQQDLSLMKISKYAKLNHSYFSHYFKKIMEESYSDFIIKIRMENAKKILDLNPQIKINNLVFAVGYKSQPYFYKAFKKYSGHSPSEYKGKG